MSNLLDKFIKKIAQEQSSGDRYFPDGLLPAYRSNPHLSYTRPDTTLFFSVISGFTLQSLRGRVPVESQSLIDRIVEKIKKLSLPK